MNLNLHLLRVFYTVALEKSFSNAAKVLFISQPAVSKSVQELEFQLGLPLIDRNKNTKKQSGGILLTKEGQTLFEHARAIFALERSAVEDIQAIVQIKKGRLSIGASTTIASYWLPEFLAKFAEKYPTIEISVKVSNTKKISQKLVDGEIDFALVEGSVEDARIASSLWQQENLEIVSHPSKGLKTKADLNKQTWLIREAGSGTHEVMIKLLESLALQPKTYIELGSNEMIAQAVAKGLGVSILPERVIHNLLTLKQLKIIDVPQKHSLKRPLFILTLQNRPFSPLMQVFHQLLTASISN